MKSRVLAALLIAASQPLCIGQQTSPIAVSITTSTPVTESGKEIRVDVTIMNTTDQTIRILKALGPDGQAEAVNHIEVYDAEGKKLSRIDGPAVQMHGQTYHLQKYGLSRKTVPVDPGKSNDDFLILSNLFDLSKPGSYTVVVRHERMQLELLRPEDRISLVSSNKITITVTD